MATRVGVLLAVMVWANSGVAQEAEVVAAGKHEFRQHCALCHGVDGKGDSVMVNLNLLANTPPDLTQLKKQHAGTFPFWQVYRIVDGREPVQGHGTLGMPVWGDLFAMHEGKGLAAEPKAAGRILNLVHYLQSVQEQ